MYLGCSSTSATIVSPVWESCHFFMNATPWWQLSHLPRAKSFVLLQDSHDAHTTPTKPSPTLASQCVSKIMLTPCLRPVIGQGEGIHPSKMDGWMAGWNIVLYCQYMVPDHFVTPCFDWKENVLRINTSHLPQARCWLCPHSTLNKALVQRLFNLLSPQSPPQRHLASRSPRSSPTTGLSSGGRMPWRRAGAIAWTWRPACYGSGRRRGSSSTAASRWSAPCPSPVADWALRRQTL